MYVLELTKGLSCRVGKMRATKEQPICRVEDKESADLAVASGYFKLVRESVDEVPEGGTEKPISKMTIDECKAFAKEHGIDISGLSKVAELREKISAVSEAEAPESDMVADMGEE